MSTRKWVAFASICACCVSHAFLVVTTAPAALLAYEPFNYDNIGGDLNGQSGAGSSGFSGAWTGNTSFNIGNGSLTSPVPLITSGNDMTTVAFGGNRDITRTLSTSLGTENTTRYVSFLIRPDGILHQGAFGGWFAFSLRGTQEVNLGMLFSSSSYGLEVAGTASPTTKNAVVGETVFLVARFDFTEGVDPVRLYVNPQPGAPEPAVPSASQINLNVDMLTYVDLTGPGAYSVDEIRIGTTYADVTPIPEPSTMCALVLMTCLSLGGARLPRSKN